MYTRNEITDYKTKMPPIIFKYLRIHFLTLFVIRLEFKLVIQPTVDLVFGLYTKAIFHPHKTHLFI
jgi:hypothetical protein